jgi:hypothetical protein
MDLYHMVVAMKGDRIVKVQCKTCRKDHVYKAPKGVTDPGAAPPPKTASTRKSRASGESKSEAVPVETEWVRMMNIHPGGPSKGYSAKGQFELGDKIDHPTFGEGIVGKVIFPNKIEVVFRHDVKTLICGGQPA